MKLTISLADAVTFDKKGTVCVLGLGITRLRIQGSSGLFTGAFVIIVEPTDEVEGSKHNFVITCTPPSGEQKMLASGTFTLGAPADQFAMGHAVAFQIQSVGSYAVTVTCGAARAETRLLVEQNAPGTVPASSP